MDDQFVKRLLALEDALQTIAVLPRRAGLFEAQRIAAAALKGESSETAFTGPSLADPIYYARVRRGLEANWNNRCAYCEKGPAEVGPLEIEHAIPVSRGGTDQPNNFLLACHACNQRKGTQTYAEFGYGDLMFKLAGQILGGR